MPKLPTVAVTGGSGFVGRYVLENLLKRHIEVTATYKRQHCNLPHDVRWIRLDLDASPSDVFSALGEPDILIHLAWGELANYRSPRHLEDELPRQTSLLKSLIDYGLQSLVVTGTCFEYGLQEGELSESETPAPHLPYAQAKNALRDQLERYCAENGANLTWLRLFYLYGDGQPERTLYSQFQRAVRNKQSMFNMSPGDQKRDYLHIKEAASMLCELALQKRDMGIVNLCSAAPVTVRSLVESWREKSRSDISLNLGHFPYADWEPMAFWGSAVKLRSLLAGH